MNRFAPALAATCLALSAAVAFAQTPPAEPRKGPSPEHRQQMKERMKAMHEACKDKPDRHACMIEQRCAKSQDKAKCEAKAKEHGQRHTKRMDQRQEMHEACTGKRGEELGKCLREQRGKFGHGKSDRKS